MTTLMELLKLMEESTFIRESLNISPEVQELINLKLNK
jgi:hypothetical protein